MTTPPTRGYLGFADESFTSSTATPNIYMFAGLILDPENADAARAHIEALRLPRQRKIHWHGDSETRHDQVIDAICSLPLEAVLLIRTGSSAERDERRRRKTLEPFIYELEQSGCTDLTLESRGPHADQQDRSLLDALRSQHRSHDLRIHHQPGPVEPLLAIPDAICGAHNATRHGTTRWWDALSPRTHLIEIKNP